MSKNVLVIPFEVIVSSQNVVEKATKILFYFAIIATFFYLCLMVAIHHSHSQPLREHRHRSLHSYPHKGPSPLDTKNESPENMEAKNFPASKENVPEIIPKSLILKSREDISSESPNPIFETNNWIDEMSPVHYPWPNVTQCKDFTIKFGKNHTFIPKALVSFPGSGNSWLRYIIECSSGIFTGSVYDSIVIYKQSLYGEFRKPADGTTIIQKTHYDTIYKKNATITETVKKFTDKLFKFRGVFVIRNPFRSIFSYWNFLKTNDQIKHVNKLNVSNPVWISHVELCAEKWATIVRDWVEKSDDLLIVKYEELKKNPRTEIIGILNYLKVPINNQRLDCLFDKNNLEGPFHREKKSKHDELKVESALNESPTNTTVLMPNIYSMIYPSPLDTLINTKIQEVNDLFARNNIPINLDYTMPL